MTVNVKFDARLAASVASPVVRSLYTNLRIDLGAKVSRPDYPGIGETSFDPFDPATAADPSPAYRSLLAGPRVHYSRRRNMFVLSRYAAVRAAARNDALLSSSQGVARARFKVPVLLNMDPPRH